MAAVAPDAPTPPLSPPPPAYLRSTASPLSPAVQSKGILPSALLSPNGDVATLSPSLESSENSERQIARKPIPAASDRLGNETTIQTAPRSAIKVDGSFDIPQAFSALIIDSKDIATPGTTLLPAVQSGPRNSILLPPRGSSIPSSMTTTTTTHLHTTNALPRPISEPLMQLPQPSVHHEPSPGTMGSWSVVGADEPDEKHESLLNEEESISNRPSSSSQGSFPSTEQLSDYQPLQYHHQELRDGPYARSVSGPFGRSPASHSAEHLAAPNSLLTPGRASYAGHTIPRPMSTYSSVSDLGRGRTGSPAHHARGTSAHSPATSSEVRPISSFIDLLTSPYPQPSPSPANLNNPTLRLAVGNNVSLLSHKQTFDMYLANVKKTNDSAVQYEFAVFMVNAVQEMVGELDDGASIVSSDKDPDVTRHRLLSEARSILQRLADRGYPYAQYYLADGYASGLFNRNKEDHDRAFSLFVAATKHGHVEASYRAALCYEFGWGCRVDAAKAVQFYRQAASKNHPGAMLRLGRACLTGDMGLGKRYREGIKWLKRAAESADPQYNSAPYELGLLHETGFGDDVFLDLTYAAQLFTKSAELGHAEANFRLGDAYEHGRLNCPRDPALSIHFYTGAAQAGHAQAMMALCAWYIVGAEPVLERDEIEAYEWASRAAHLGKNNPHSLLVFFFFGLSSSPLSLLFSSSNSEISSLN